MQPAARTTAFVALLLASRAVALQDTNLKVDWNVLNSTGEVNFYGSATVDGTTLNLTRDGVYNSSASVLLMVPIDVTRNFDLTLEISLASSAGSPCNSAGEGLAFGFTDASQLEPRDGPYLGLDTTKKFWAASLDAVGNSPTVEDGSNTTNNWHVSFISGDGSNAQWTTNFYDSTNLVCANLLNAQSKIRLVYLSGTMFVFVNSLLLGSENVSVSSVVGASQGRFLLSAVSGPSRTMLIHGTPHNPHPFVISV
eukprot:TRINITY_DN8346_c0_g1_i1.p1 TRINITY_DN8346_c0_g1~~TRINITY_DN8346_c0_g1_i1.p1  ORF type:complete len:253 (+),score=27.18 TRINITY_DN8346_c0_g1_i1:46-804(+)